MTVWSPDEKFTKYGLTREKFDGMFAAQDYRCAICRTDDCGPRGWVIDHDHKCCKPRHRGEWKKSCGRCVRGIICHPCNLGLGQFRDDPKLLARAFKYLKKYATVDGMA